jgi:pimeloyl-ACP methyl ester carboxylesterase
MNATQILLIGFLLCFAATAVGEDVPESTAEDKPSVNLDTKTFGGKQFWTDELVFQDWRIQRNAITGHCRLLDDHNVRRAWGKFDECNQVLERTKHDQQLPVLKPRVVIVLHGLIRSRESMEGLQKYLRQQDDFSVLNVSYASTRAKLSEHAAALAHVMEHLDGVQEVSFVGHSLGNLVVRHYLSDRARGVHGDRPVPRIGRIVMLGPPNNGTEMARKFQDNAIFRAVWGISGKELAIEWSALQEHLAVPTGEFGIIAGGKGTDEGRNPLLTGDDDFIVSIEETRLPGAADFLVRPVMHSFIMDDKTVQECTLRFLQHGYFVSADDRRPIPRSVAAAND